MDFPLVVEIPYIAPENALTAFPLEGLLFLDSANASLQQAQGRYSFIALDPFQMLVYKHGQSTLGEGNPFDILEAHWQKYTLPYLPDYPPFQGGVAGMLGYELGGYLEKLPVPEQDDLDFPEMMLGFYDLVIAWDHVLSKAWIFSSGFPETTPALREARAIERKDWVLQCLEHPPSHSVLRRDSLRRDIEIRCRFTQPTYEKAVEQVIEYIRAGDIFEVNISQSFWSTLPESCSALDLYNKLRQNNPAPFAAFMQYGKYKIASASPERFIKLNQNKVETRPIKGTRPRSTCPIEDKAYAQALQDSEKDHAENVMIVDLMRNDLSRVCLPHSVKVTQLCGLESFATVHHLVSAVEGFLEPGKNAIDLLKATFPGGSITGAPKIRAMEIIAEIEPHTRGPYCGSMGYIGFNGEMDLSITIRTFALRDNIITFQTGGAVTVDSDPTEEFQETLTKASALTKTLKTIGSSDANR